MESLLANTTLVGARNADAPLLCTDVRRLLHKSALCGVSNARQSKQPPVSALIARLIVRGEAATRTRTVVTRGRGKGGEGKGKRER